MNEEEMQLLHNLLYRIQEKSPINAWIQAEISQHQNIINANILIRSTAGQFDINSSGHDMGSLIFSLKTQVNEKIREWHLTRFKPNE